MPRSRVALAIALLLLPSTAALAKSSFRLIDLTVDGKDVVVKVAVHNDHQVGTVVDLYAHAQPAAWSDKPPGALPVRQGLKISSSTPKAGDSTATIRVPLADLKARGIARGDTLHLVGNWVTGENNSGGHDWGSLAGVGGQLSTTSQAIPNSALSRSRSALSRSALSRSALSRSALSRSALSRSALSRSALSRRFGHRRALSRGTWLLRSLGDGGRHRHPWRKRSARPAPARR